MVAGCPLMPFADSPSAFLSVFREAANQPGAHSGRVNGLDGSVFDLFQDIVA
jgi:hypothetical protein